MPKIWISHQKCLKLQTDIPDPILDLHSSNLVRIHMDLICKYVFFCYAISNGQKLSQINVECSIHILRCPFLRIWFTWYCNVSLSCSCYCQCFTLKRYVFCNIAQCKSMHIFSVQNHNNFEQKVTKNDHCVPKMCLVAF